VGYHHRSELLASSGEVDAILLLQCWAIMISASARIGFTDPGQHDVQIANHHAGLGCKELAC
jgi:hypothetical protein